MASGEHDTCSTASPALPPELGILVDFLSADLRPSIVLSVDARAAHASIIYTNPAYDRAHKLHDSLSNLVRLLAAKVENDPTLITHNGSVVLDNQWQTRISGGYCIAVVADQDKNVYSDSEGQSEGEHAPEAVPQPSDGSKSLSRGSAHEAVMNATPSKDTEELISSDVDWTRHAIKDMSPWIRFLREFDWAATALGALDTWTDLLRASMLQIMLNPSPRIIVWGKEKTFIYNEACIQLFGAKHPGSLGKPTSHHWSEIWEWLEPILNACFQGEVTAQSNQPLLLNRQGFLEETYWGFTLLPIFDQDGTIGGLLDELVEVTDTVTAIRRRKAIADANARTSAANTLPALWNDCRELLDSISIDIAYAIIYSTIKDVDTLSEASGKVSAGADSSSAAPEYLLLHGTVGIPADEAGLTTTYYLDGDCDRTDGLGNALLYVYRTRKPTMLSATDDSLPKLLACGVPSRGIEESIKDVLVYPITSTLSDEIYGVLFIGINPRCIYNEEYQLFLQFIMDFISRGATNISLPEEQRRAEELANDINNALTQQLRVTTLAAKQSEAKFSRLAASSPTGMFMFDVDGRPLHVNDAYLHMLGLSRTGSSGRQSDSFRWERHIHEDDLGRFHNAWKSLVSDRAPITIEYRMKETSQNNGETWLLATAFPELDADGQLHAILGWLTDITHQRLADKLLAQQLAEALENKRQTENFIDMTSHEMRNPLSAILQSADAIVSTISQADTMTDNSDTILSAEDTEHILDAASTVILCAQHQKRIVDDILTLSKLDASLLAIVPDKVQPPTLIRKALEMYDGEIRKADLNVELCIGSNYSELAVDSLSLDPDRLLQVIINLLTNAIKFTKDSKVRDVKVYLDAFREKPTGQPHGIVYVPPRSRDPMAPSEGEHSSNEDEHVFLEIAVHDTGKGLSSDEMQMLFQRFQQANPKTYSQYGGSGLGLFISRTLCEMQGGQIGVASGASGTVFAFFVQAKRWQDSAAPDSTGSHEHITTPASGSASSTETSILPPDAKANSHSQIYTAVSARDGPSDNSARSASTPDIKREMHVLIVEDNLINQKILGKQLQRLGCIVHVADHGLECLAFLSSSTFCAGGATSLSLILLDLEMPVMDGLTCIQEIRSKQISGEIAGHVPVIAITANARSEQISAAVDAGIDVVVTKPFRLPELMSQMEGLIKARTRSTT